MSNTTLRYPTWQEQSQQALLEINPEERQRKIEKARIAALARLQQLSKRPAARKEREAIADAFRILKDLDS